MLFEGNTYTPNEKTFDGQGPYVEVFDVYTIKINVEPDSQHDAWAYPNISNHQHTNTIMTTSIPFIMSHFNIKYKEN